MYSKCSIFLVLDSSCDFDQRNMTDVQAGQNAIDERLHDRILNIALMLLPLWLISHDKITRYGEPG